MRIFFTSGLLLLACCSYCQESNQVKLIRTQVEAINKYKGYTTRNLNNDYFADKDEDADNGQELTGYYKNGVLQKMVYSVGLSYAMKVYQYYFSDRALIFVYEKESDYPLKKDGSVMDNSRLVPVFEGRYYIYKGKTILSRTKGHERMPEKDKTRIVNMVDDLVEDLKQAEDH